ncbi:TonB-dependent hemoglobin/transferrin/lactoferrin family receptor [Oligella urethralis]|nr:TonB-dependent hemoglobin/transferrin/lactoferrin family receptor [Oligella urethralis]
MRLSRSMSRPLFKESIVLSAILTALSSAAYAQEQMEHLGEVNVVSTSELLPLEPSNVQNASITLLGIKDIDRSTNHSASDLFRYTPGVHFERSNTARVSDIVIRGMGGAGSEDGTGQNRIAINIDGIPVNDTFVHGHITRNTRATFDISDLKQVEVLKGPGVIGPGKSGLAGTVNYTTKDPQDYYQDNNRYGGNIRTGYDSQDRSNFIGGTVASDLSDTLSAMFSFTHRTLHELKNKGGLDVVGPDRTRSNPSRGNSQNYLAKLVFQPSNAHKFTLKMEHFRLSNRIDELDNQYALTGNYEDYNKNKRSAFSLRHDFNANTMLFDSGYWQIYTQKTKQTREQDLAYGIPSYAITGYDVKSSGAQLGLSKRLHTGSVNHNLQYGFNYERTSTEVSWLWDARVFRMGLINAPFQPKTVVNNYNFYLADDIDLLNGHWFITPGVSVGHYKLSPKATTGYDDKAPFTTSSRNYVNAEIGTRFNLNDYNQLFLSYRQGLRAQSFAEMNSAGFHSRSLPNPDLKPEKSRGFELGLRSYGRYGNQTITAFHTTYTDMITKTTFGRYPNNASTMINKSGKVVIYGLEYEGNLNLAEAFGTPEGWSLTAGLAYAKGRDRELDQPWSAVDPINGFLRLGFDDPSDIWGVATTLNFAKGKKEKDIDAEQLQSSNGYRPVGGYGTLDITGYVRMAKHFHINAGVYNVGDRKYVTWNDAQSAALVGNDYNRMTRPGRTFAINLRYEF